MEVWEQSLACPAFESPAAASFHTLLASPASFHRMASRLQIAAERTSVAGEMVALAVEALVWKLSLRASSYLLSLRQALHRVLREFPPFHKYPLLLNRDREPHQESCQSSL